jgi:hypothetical protein
MPDTPLHVPTKVRRITVVISTFGGCPPTQIERDQQRNWGCPVFASAGSFSSIIVINVKRNDVLRQSLFGWGDNSLGQVGWLVDNDGISRNPISDPAWRVSNAPYLMRDFEFPRYKFGLIVQLSSGAFHNLALTDADELLTWGWNLRGQLGSAPPELLLMSASPINIRRNIMSSAQVVKIAAGGYHNLVLMSDGMVWAWGSNYYGQLGLGIESQAAADENGPRPFKPSTPRNTVYLPNLVQKFYQQNRFVIDIAAGQHHSYAIAECFGTGFPNNVHSSRQSPSNATRNIASKINGHWVFNYSDFVAAPNVSCDCIFGYKGADCSQQCLTVEKTDVCSVKPARRSPQCSLTARVACSARGTYDQQEFRFDERRDAMYDCNRDATCTCRSGSTGSDCSIDCVPTEEFRFREGVGDLLNCACQEGYEGLRCDKSTALERVMDSSALQQRFAAAAAIATAIAVILM